MEVQDIDLDYDSGDEESLPAAQADSPLPPSIHTAVYTGSSRIDRRNLPDSPRSPYFTHPTPLQRVTSDRNRDHHPDHFGRRRLVLFLVELGLLPRMRRLRLLCSVVPLRGMRHPVDIPCQCLLLLNGVYSMPTRFQPTTARPSGPAGRCLQHILPPMTRFLGRQWQLWIIGLLRRSGLGHTYTRRGALDTSR